LHRKAAIQIGRNNPLNHSMLPNLGAKKEDALLCTDSNTKQTLSQGRDEILFSRLNQAMRIATSINVAWATFSPRVYPKSIRLSTVPDGDGKEKTSFFPCDNGNAYDIINVNSNQKELTR
jgi:hypothetical protein